MKQHRNHLSVCAFCTLFALVLVCACNGSGFAQEQAQPASAGDKAAPAPAPAPAATPAPGAPAEASNAPAVPVDPNAPQPKFVVPEPTFDFGSLDADTIINHDFILRNEGLGVLEIKDVKPGCGCTTTQLANKILQPGQEEKLNTTLNLKGRQGKLTKTVMVSTNDPAKQFVTLTLTGSVIAPIVIDPEVIALPRVEDDNPRSATLKVSARKEGATFTIKKVDIDGMDFMESEVKTVTPGKEYTIEVRSKGALPVGLHSGRMVIQTDYPDRTIIFCSMNVQVVGSLLVMPPTVNLRYSETPGEKGAQQIGVDPGRIKEFNLTGVVTPVEGMKAEIKELSDNHYAVALSEMPLDGSLDGKELILKTDVASAPEMRVPFKMQNMKTDAQKAAASAAPASAPAAAPPSAAPAPPAQ